MISVSYPSSGVGKYADIGGFLVGPIDVGDPQEVTYFRHPWDRLDEFRHPKTNENDCYNFQVIADLRKNAIADNLVAAPTSVHPERITFGSSAHVYGLAGLGAWGRNFAGSGNFSCRVIDYGGGYDLTLWTLTLSRGGTFGVYNATQTELRMTSFTNTRINYEQRTRTAADANHYYHYDMTSGVDAPAVRAIVLGLLARKGKEAWGTWSTTFAPVINAIHSYSSWDIVTLGIGWTAADMFLNLESLELKDFGDLAQTAAENFSATNVNMLEFISDMRNPLQMVPKLRNLAKLKDWAGRYLTVKYGILPTVSDIQKIVESAQRVRGNLDRNGHRTSSAGYILEEKINSIDHRLEQHLKLAVDNDDAELVSMCSSLDNIGMNPKLSNLWDLVPMSFAIDWFVNVGDYLERTEGIQKLSRFNVRYVTMSHKRTLTTELSALSGFTGQITMVDYRRWTQGQCPLPKASLSTPFSVSDHWLEAAALTIQRIK